MPLFLYSTLFSLFSTRLLSVILQRRIAEPQIFFETFQAVLRALQQTFGEVAEAVGTLRGFPLHRGRRGLRFIYSEYHLQRKSPRFLQSTNLGFAVCAPSATSRDSVSCYVFLCSLYLQNLCAFAPPR